MMPARPRTPAVPQAAEMRTLAFPDLRGVFRDELARTEDPVKAFLAVQVELILASAPGQTRERVEESVARSGILDMIRAYPGDLRSYCQGAAAGLMQGLDTAFMIARGVRVLDVREG